MLWSHICVLCCILLLTVGRFIILVHEEWAPLVCAVYWYCSRCCRHNLILLTQALHTVSCEESAHFNIVISFLLWPARLRYGSFSGRGNCYPLNRLDQLWGPPSILFIRDGGGGSFPGNKVAWGVKLTTHLTKPELELVSFYFSPSSPVYYSPVPFLCPAPLCLRVVLVLFVLRAYGS
jgi:hypothetical protein